MVIGPGEYFESVRRQDLGGPDADTTIRAAIPGTVLLRGDIPAPEFRKLDGFRHVYVADFDEPHDVQVVNELDTLNVLERKPNIAELDYSLGTFHQDAETGKLYLSATDAKAANRHRYSLSVIPTHGMYFRNPERLIIDGVAVTGFNAASDIDREDESFGSVWGFFLVAARDSVIRSCAAYLNGRGIGINSRARVASEPGGNLVEASSAWANMSQFGGGDSGGISLLDSRRDTIRDSESFLNGAFGMNMYMDSPAAALMENQSVISNTLSWGNGSYDYKNKTGDNVHLFERVLGTGEIFFTHHVNMEAGLVGGPVTCLPCRSATDAEKEAGADSIVLDEESDLDLAAEFADPENRDYRLQSTSRFRDRDGEDRGPFPYTEDIYYVSPGGDDDNDGLSVEHAFATLAHAASILEPGDTLYLQPGTYAEDLELRLHGSSDAAISVRARGTEPALIEGRVRIVDSRHVALERLHFARDVEVRDSDAVEFSRCAFMGDGRGLTGVRTTGLQVRHSSFTGFSTAGLRLACSRDAHVSGNLFDNETGVGVRVERAQDVRYADYNSYRDATTAWSIERGTHDEHSVELVPEFSREGGVAALDNPSAFAAAGPFARPTGPYRYEPREQSMELIHGPEVHSVSATTANIEWLTSLPAVTDVTWGRTPEGGNDASIHVDRFGTYSLTGLEPSTTYHFTIEGLAAPEDADVTAAPAELDAAVSFTTTATDHPANAPDDYYVAVDGDDDNAGTLEAPWRTLQHAANEVNVGDTVHVRGGSYQETVRIKASGTAAAPIAFRAYPGERVVLEGADKALNRGFTIVNKEHLVFDGFFFKDFNSEVLNIQQWHQELSAELFIYQSREIELRRILSDGRYTSNAHTARSVVAIDVPNLLIKNFVSTNKMSSAMIFRRCNGLRIENSVFVRPKTSALFFLNRPDESATLSNNIFTDILKEEANFPLFIGVNGLKRMVQRDNAYYLAVYSPSERELFEVGTWTEANAWKHSHTDGQPDLVIDPVFRDVEDPLFDGHTIGEIVNQRREVEYDFDLFMPVDDTLVDRGIGLEPGRFDSGLPN